MRATVTDNRVHVEYGPAAPTCSREAPDGGRGSTGVSRREVHAADLQQPVHVRDLVRVGARGAVRRGGPDHEGADGVRGADPRRGAGGPVEHEDGPGPGWRPGGDGRAAGGGQGAVRRVHRGRVRQHRAGRRNRRPLARREALRDGGAAGDARLWGGDVMDVTIEGLLRDLAPQVLGTFLRRHGHFDACEDAVQEALLAAALQWPEQGVPDNPRGWLLTVASRRLADQQRSEAARRRREAAVAALAPAGEAVAPPADEERVQ